MSEGWDWSLTDRAHRQFDGLDDYGRGRISSKLDEIVADEWREPTEYLEPLQGAPHQKIRIGPFRLGCRADRDAEVLYVLSISKRSTAYRGDD